MNTTIRIANTLGAPASSTHPPISSRSLASMIMNTGATAAARSPARSRSGRSIRSGAPGIRITPAGDRRGTDVRAVERDRPPTAAVELCGRPMHSPTAYPVLAEIVSTATAPASISPSANTVATALPEMCRSARERRPAMPGDVRAAVTEQRRAGDQRPTTEDRGHRPTGEGVIASVTQIRRGQTLVGRGALLEEDHPRGDGRSDRRCDQSSSVLRLPPGTANRTGTNGRPRPSADGPGSPRAGTAR